MRAAERHRVLLVDDFDDAREMYATFLRLLGWDVEEARNGREAIEVAAERKPSLVLMDLAMPGIDGWEATRQLRRQASPRRMEILVLTACIDPESLDRARAAGADGVIMKPCLPSELAERVEAHLARDSVKLRAARPPTKPS